MANTNEHYGARPDDGRKPKVKHALYKPLTFFFIIVAIIFVMSVFFKISNIEVEGNNLYTDEEVISASGIQKGDSLFFLNRIGAGSRVVVKLPYVDSVQITRSLPNYITIRVEESKTVGFLNINGEKWTVNYMGKFLNKVSDEEAAKLAPISGITVKTAAVGDIMQVDEADADKLAYLLEIMYQIQARGLTASIGGIDISNIANPSFDYDGRFVVLLGEKTDTEYKFGKMLSAVGQLTDSDEGTLDLSEADKVYFAPN